MLRVVFRSERTVRILCFPPEDPKETAEAFFKKCFPSSVEISSQGSETPSLTCSVGKSETDGLFELPSLGTSLVKALTAIKGGASLVVFQDRRFRRSSSRGNGAKDRDKAPMTEGENETDGSQSSHDGRSRRMHRTRTRRNTYPPQAGDSNFRKRRHTHHSHHLESPLADRRLRIRYSVRKEYGKRMHGLRRPNPLTIRRTGSTASDLEVGSFYSEGARPTAGVGLSGEDEERGGMQEREVGASMPNVQQNTDACPSPAGMPSRQASRFPDHLIGYALARGEIDPFLPSLPHTPYETPATAGGPFSSQSPARITSEAQEGPGKLTDREVVSKEVTVDVEMPILPASSGAEEMEEGERARMPPSSLCLSLSPENAGGREREGECLGESGVSSDPSAGPSRDPPSFSPAGDNSKRRARAAEVENGEADGGGTTQAPSTGRGAAALARLRFHVTSGRLASLATQESLCLTGPAETEGQTSGEGGGSPAPGGGSAGGTGGAPPRVSLSSVPENFSCMASVASALLANKRKASIFAEDSPLGDAPGMGVGGGLSFECLEGKSFYGKTAKSVCGSVDGSAVDERERAEDDFDAELNMRAQVGSGYCVVLPDSQARLFWDFTALLIIVFQAFTIPFEIAFEPEWAFAGGASGPWQMTNILINVFFALDIALNFCTGFYKHGLLVLDNSAIAREYLKGGFAVDFIATVPWAYLVEAFVDSDEAMRETEGLKVIRITRIVKFVRVLRLVRLLKLRRLSVKIYEQVSSRVMTLIISLVKLFFMIFMIAHWSGCLFFLIGDAQGEGEDPDVPVSWVEADGIREASIGVQYVASLYWALTTLTTVGYGDITPVSIDERLYTMVIELLAAALFGMVVSNMASLLAVFNQQQTLKNEQLVEATAFLKKKGVPRELMLRVRRFLEFVFSNERQTTADGSRFMEHLTESLRDEVHYHLVERTLRGFPLFGDGSHHQLVRLARICTTVMLAPGDVLVQEGGVGDAMYFVVKGTLKRSARGKDKIPPVTEGQWFGQETLFADWVWPWTVRCMAFCEIVRIHHEDFQELIRTFPALEKRYFDVQDMLEQGDWSVIQRECPWCKNPDHYNDNCPVYVKGAQAPDDLEETLSQVPLEELHGGEEGGKGRVKHLIIRSRKLMERVFVVPSRLKAYKPKRVPRAPSSRSLRSKRTGGDTAERGAMAERRTLSRIPSGGSVNGVVEGENDRGGMCEGTRCCCGARRSGERGRLEDEEEERIEQVGEGGGGGRLPSGRLASSVASSALSLGGREREPKRLNTSSKALTKRPKRGRSISFMFNGSRDLQAQRFASTPAPVVGQSAADAAASVAAAGADTREATASTMVQSVNTERERASDRERVGEGGGERDRRIGGVGVGPTTGGFSSRNARAQTLSG